MQNLAKTFFVVLSVLVISTVVTASQQFKGVPMDSGVAFAPTEAVDGQISLAGGGVVLRGITKCDAAQSDLCEFDNVTIVQRQESRDSVMLEASYKSCVVRHKIPTWIARSAADLVDSETAVVYRNVNLLGKPTKEEIQRFGQDATRSYWFIEVSEPLVQTKVGETLLLIDLLLTDPAFYAATAGKSVNQSLEESSEVKIFLENWPKPFNWTWTDEQANPTFRVDCERHKLTLSGKPQYTFLYIDRSIDLETTRYYEQHESDIISLHPTLYENSTEFARVASYLRFVKIEYPQLWLSLRAQMQKLAQTSGSTPRVIER